MKTSNRSFVVLSLAALALPVLWVGCGGLDDDVRRDTFAVIGGEPLTAEYVSNTVMVSARIVELARRPVKPDQFARWGNAMAMKMTPGLIQAIMLDQELRRRGISQTADSDGKVLEKYNRMAKQKAGSIDELAPLFGDFEGHFRRQFERESRFQAFYATNRELEVTDEDVRLHYRSLTNSLKRLSRIDANARQKAEAAWSRLNGGESWEVVATNCTEDALLDKGNAENWKEWMSFKPEEVEPQELKSALAMLKVGGYTCPIETDEGLVIVRVTEREDNLISCARILFRMAIKLEIPTREEAIRDLRQEKKVQLQNEVLSDARERVKIEYPLGTNFTYRIWPMPTGKGKPTKL